MTLRGLMETFIHSGDKVFELIKTRILEAELVILVLKCNFVRR